MTLDRLLTFCQNLPGAVEDFPFGEGTLVFKIGSKKGKIFAFVSLEAIPPRVSLKGDPTSVIERRERFPSVFKPPYLNKKHWLGVRLEGDVPTEDVQAWVEESYSLVRAGLTRAAKEALPPWESGAKVPGRTHGEASR